jgi:hypothetical protein
MHQKFTLQWLKSIIPAIQEVEIQRILIQGQLHKKLARHHLYQQAGSGGAGLVSNFMEGIGRRWSLTGPRQKYETLSKKD